MAANVFELNVNITSTVKSEAQNALDNFNNGSTNSIEDTNNNDKKKTNIGNDIKASSKEIGAAASALGAVELGVTAMNWAHSRVSTIYKDQARANHISNVQSTVGMVGGIVAQGAAGAAWGGPVGAVAGVAIGIATEALKAAQRVEAWKDKQKDYADESDYSMERLGLLIASKGR